MSATLTGDKALMRKLDKLSTKSSKKAARAGINAGLTPVVKAMRAAVDASDASQEMKAAARKLVGKKQGKAKRGAAKGTYVAKAGFGVGPAAKQKPSKHTTSGVGIGFRNIHWFVLGTKEHPIAPKKATTLSWVDVHDGGTTFATQVIHPGIKPPFGDVVQKAVAVSQAASLKAARDKIHQVILKESRKKG